MKSIEQLRKEAAEYGRNESERLGDLAGLPENPGKMLSMTEKELARFLEQAFLAGWRASRDGVNAC